MTGEERVVLSVSLNEYADTVHDSIKQAEHELKMNPRDHQAQESLADCKKDLQAIANLKAIFGL